MNKDKYVFAQLVEFLNKDKFRHLIDKYDGNQYVKSFTCWNQLLALTFGKLSNRESLHNVVVALETNHSKLLPSWNESKFYSKNNISHCQSKSQLSYL